VESLLSSIMWPMVWGGGQLADGVWVIGMGSTISFGNDRLVLGPVSYLSREGSLTGLTVSAGLGAGHLLVPQ
jgi:hypothetical protein